MMNFINGKRYSNGWFNVNAELTSGVAVTGSSEVTKVCNIYDIIPPKGNGSLTTELCTWASLEALSTWRGSTGVPSYRGFWGTNREMPVGFVRATLYVY